mmetsp:Transcript_12409/g.23494  ORF Transcript_12409/g.23494 Transcript_12409/m.23494 type:complete len:114 (+) Transcript_12409:797-1138(+)
MVKLKEVFGSGKTKKKDQRKAKAENKKALEKVLKVVKKKQPKAKGGAFGLLSSFGDALSEVAQVSKAEKPSKAQKWLIKTQDKQRFQAVASNPVFQASPMEAVRQHLASRAKR